MSNTKRATWSALSAICGVALASCAGSSGALPHGTEVPDRGAEQTAGSISQPRGEGAAGAGGTGLGSLQRDAGSGGAAGATRNGGPSSHDSLYVQDGALYDRCGERVVLRGINHPTLYVDRSGDALPEIAKTGANSVRLFWFAEHGVAISEAEPAIFKAIEQHMIPILEMHDSTCDWALDGIVEYWTSDEAVALIQRYAQYLIVNIANEPSAPDPSAFRTTYSAVIQTMRRAGIHVPLMIDGATCGRDYRVLLDQGRALLDADPEHNLIFSAHLYDPLSTSQLGAIFRDFSSAKLPFVVGEFANKEPPGCGAPLQYAGLIEQAAKYGVGWLAWSWGDDDPNNAWNDDCDEFDMTSTFAFTSLAGWGAEVAVTSPASIMHTSKRPRSLVSGQCE